MTYREHSKQLWQDYSAKMVAFNLANKVLGEEVQGFFNKILWDNILKTKADTEKALSKLNDFAKFWHDNPGLDPDSEIQSQ